MSTKKLRTVTHSTVLLIQADSLIAMHNLQEVLRRHIASDDALDIHVSTMDRLDPKVREWFDIWFKLHPGEKLHDRDSTSESRKEKHIKIILREAAADKEVQS